MATVHFDTTLPHRYHRIAGMFLEDAEALQQRLRLSYGNFTSHIERYLSGAAIFLRRASEAHFGPGKWNEAPDQMVMHFISAACHIGARAVVDTFFGEARKFQARWNNTKRSGEAYLIISTGLDFDADKGTSRQHRDQALRFLARHRGDIFLALHAATETVAKWTGARVDEDFAALRDAQLGHARLRAEFSHPSKFKRFLSDATGHGEFTFSGQNALSVVEFDNQRTR